jgi:hypothetical protein
MKYIKSCCKTNNYTRKCIRKDKKVFKLPRRFSKNKCLTKKISGFSMKSSCAPYKFCKKTKKNSKKMLKKMLKKMSKKNSKKMSKKYKVNKKSKKEFLFNPNNPKKSFDVYIDKNPKDTIHIKYTTVDDVLNTINKLENLYKNDKYSHKRIWQVAMIMKVRLETIKKYKKTLYPNAKNVDKRFKLAEKYFKFLGKRTKEKSNEKRKKMIFKHDL